MQEHNSCWHLQILRQHGSELLSSCLLLKSLPVILFGILSYQRLQPHVPRILLGDDWGLAERPVRGDKQDDEITHLYLGKPLCDPPAHGFNPVPTKLLVVREPLQPEHNLHGLLLFPRTLNDAKLSEQEQRRKCCECLRLLYHDLHELCAHNSRLIGEGPRLLPKPKHVRPSDLDVFSLWLSNFLRLLLAGGQGIRKKDELP